MASAQEAAGAAPKEAAKPETAATSPNNALSAEQGTDANENGDGIGIAPMTSHLLRPGLYALRDFKRHCELLVRPIAASDSMGVQQRPTDFPFDKTICHLYALFAALPPEKRNLASFCRYMCKKAGLPFRPLKGNLPARLVMQAEIQVAINALGERFNLSHETVIECWKVLRNCLILYHSVYDGQMTWMGVYHKISLINHSCQPNCALFAESIPVEKQTQKEKDKDKDKDKEKEKQKDEDKDKDKDKDKEKDGKDLKDTNDGKDSKSKTDKDKEKEKDKDPQLTEPQMRLISIRPIRKKEDLTINYFEFIPEIPLANKRERARLLQLWYGFECRCSLCFEEASTATVPLPASLESDHKSIDHMLDQVGTILENFGTLQKQWLLQSHQAKETSDGLHETEMGTTETLPKLHRECWDLSKAFEADRRAFRIAIKVLEEKSKAEIILSHLTTVPAISTQQRQRARKFRYILINRKNEFDWALSNSVPHKIYVWRPIFLLLQPLQAMQLKRILMDYTISQRWQVFVTAVERKMPMVMNARLLYILTKQLLADFARCQYSTDGLFQMLREEVPTLEEEERVSGCLVIAMCKVFEFVLATNDFTFLCRIIRSWKVFQQSRLKFPAFPFLRVGLQLEPGTFLSRM
jgi:hypothetical protein